MSRPRVHTLKLTTAFVAALAAAPPVLAADVASPPPVTPAVAIELLHGGLGNQTDPHISGTLVSYTNRSSSSFSEIRYADVATGSNAAIPNDGGTYFDTISDIHGSTIVFTRRDATTSTQSIHAFDTTRPDDVTRGLDPDDARPRRTNASIGGGMVAWQEARGLTANTEMVVHDLATGATQALTSDGDLFNLHPAVSPDGTVVAWSRCASPNVGCVLLRSLRGPEGWSAPVALAPGGGNQVLPDTNGSLVVYADDASVDWDIRWVNVDGTGSGQLVSAGTHDINPNISGSFVSFERIVPGETNADVYGYDLESGVLYRLTNTPDVNERINDVSLGADGIARVAYARGVGTSDGDDVYLATFRLRSITEYEICPLFDTTKSHKLGSTVPIRLRLCDSSGSNLSSADLAVTATGLVKQDGTASTALAEDTGNANPDGGFRYDPELEGYAYNLSTKGLSRGTWELRFTVTGDPNTYAIRFDIR